MWAGEVFGPSRLCFCHDGDLLEEESEKDKARRQEFIGGTKNGRHIGYGP